MFNPTFGYLIGFIISAYVMGKIVEPLKELTLVSMIISVATGFVITYNFYLGKSLPFMASITMMIPLIKDLILAFIVALTAWRGLPILKRSGIVTFPASQKNIIS